MCDPVSIYVLFLIITTPGGEPVAINKEFCQQRSCTNMKLTIRKKLAAPRIMFNECVPYYLPDPDRRERPL